MKVMKVLAARPLFYSCGRILVVCSGDSLEVFGLLKGFLVSYVHGRVNGVVEVSVHESVQEGSSLVLGSVTR